jgi:hypothetical protein
MVVSFATVLIKGWIDDTHIKINDEFNIRSGSTTSPRKYLRTVIRDNPVLRAISRIESWSRSAQRRITLSNSMSITPVTPAENSKGKVKTWVSSRWKFAPNWVSSQ